MSRKEQTETVHPTKQIKEFRKFHKEMERKRFGSKKANKIVKQWAVEIETDPIAALMMLIAAGSAVVIFISALVEAFK